MVNCLTKKNKLTFYLHICTFVIYLYYSIRLKALKMRSFLFLLSGIFAGLYISWPGMVISENWKCFNSIITKSAEDKISIKAVMEVSPNYLIKNKNKNIYSKIRIVADACFR